MLADKAWKKKKKKHARMNARTTQVFKFVTPFAMENLVEIFCSEGSKGFPGIVDVLERSAVLTGKLLLTPEVVSL